MNTQIEARRRYVPEGAMVTLVKGKRPFLPNWQNEPLDHNKAIQLMASENATGLGLVHQHSGTMSLDIDQYDKAREWSAEYSINLDELLNDPKNYIIESPKANSKKIIFKTPESLPTAQIKDENGVMVLEFRCVGGQDVLPGSEYPDGGLYRHSGASEPQALPTKLHTRWKAELAKKTKVKVSTGANKVCEDETTLTRAEKLAKTYPPAIEGQSGDETTYKLFCQLRDLGLTNETALSIVSKHFNPRCSPPWDEYELEKKCSSAYKHAQNAQGCKAHGGNAEKILKREHPGLVKRITKLTEKKLEGSSAFIGWDVMSRSIESSFINRTNNKVVAITPSGDMPQFAVETFIKDTRSLMYGSWFDYNGLNALAGGNSPILDMDGTKLVKSLYLIVDNEFRKYLLINRQRSTIEYTTDIFAKSPKLIIKPNSAHLISNHEPFTVGKINSSVISDYKEHFPELDIFLSLLVSSRFASDRKKAFYWLQAPSDWGKGFFTSIFKELGILVELSVKEIEAAGEGRPVGRQPSDFIHCWILLVDEFKAIKSEIKLLTSSMQLAPKHQMTASVELFMKLFTSAEGVDSLAGSQGVEPQFANRFSSIDINEHTLDSRLMFASGKARYFESVKNYIAHYLNVSVEFYRSRGRTGAADIADANLEKYNRTHKLSIKHGSLDDSVVELVQYLKKSIRAFANKFDSTVHIDQKINDFLERNSERFVHDGKHVLLVRNADKLISDYINDNVDHSERAKVGHKKSAIRAKLDESSRANKNNPIRLVSIDGESSLKKGVIVYIR